MSAQLIRDGWVRAISKTHGLPYYVNVKKGISQWTLPNDNKVYTPYLHSPATRGFAWVVYIVLYFR